MWYVQYRLARVVACVRIFRGPDICVDALVLEYRHHNAHNVYTKQHASWNPGLIPTVYAPVADDYCVAHR